MIRKYKLIIDLPVEIILEIIGWIVDDMNSMIGLYKSCKRLNNVIVENNAWKIYKHRSPDWSFIRKMKCKYIICNNYIVDDIELIGLDFVERIDMNLINISDDGIKCLVNLVSLNLGENKIITDDGIKSLINLTSLFLNYNILISDNSLKYLTNLVILHLGVNETITNDGISGLIKLHMLNLGTNEIITDDGIKDLVYLRELHFIYNKKITNDGIKGLVNLEILNLGLNRLITPDVLLKLFYLKELIYMDNSQSRKIKRIRRN